MSITPGSVGGKAFNATSTTIAISTGSGVVTAGRTLIVKVEVYASAGVANGPLVTKSAGTATIDAAIPDFDLINAFDSKSRMTVFRIKILTTGTLTLSISVPASSNNNVSYHEVQSTRPLEIMKTATNSGSGALESVSVSLLRPGLIEVFSAELSTGDFVYTRSDTLEFSDSTGTANATMIAQYKNATAPGAYTITADTGNVWPWAAIAVVYQEEQKGGYTDQPRRDVPIQQRAA